MPTYGSGFYGSGTYGNFDGGRLIMSVSKRDIRHDVADELGDLWPVLTTSAGTAGGTTAVASSLIGLPISTVQNRYLLLESGDNEGEYRPIQSFAPATGTPTVRRAFTAQVASGVSGYLHVHSPHVYTLAINAAVRELYRGLRRAILHHTFVRSGNQKTIPLPRDMERVQRVLECRTTSERLRDYFDRDASATDPGSKWTASSGTWGVTSESLYSPGDTNADLLLAATSPGVHDGVIEAVVRGDTTTTASRVLALVFRYEDTSNYLYVYLENNTVYLNKRDGGTNSNLTSASVTTTENVDYLVRIMFDGSWVRVWVDDREYITYELTGANLKYLGYTENGTVTYGNVGVRLDKAGSPSLAATATRISHYFLHAIVGRTERGDWEEAADGRSLQFNTKGRGTALSEGKMLWVEGLSELTALTADTTFEALASDSTDVVEIESSDPAYRTLVLWAAYEVLARSAQPAYTGDPQLRREFGVLADRQLAKAQHSRTTKAQRLKQRAWG